MKKHYTIISLILFAISINAQNYELGIVHNSNYDFTIVATPDFDSSGNTDISDVGFTLVLPTGATDIINYNTFNGRLWTVTPVTGATLLANGLGDGTKDVFVMNLPPGQTMLSHTNGEQIPLINFQISNSPITGSLEILLNTDPIAVGLGGALDSFYNSNIDATTTQDYFSSLTTGMDNFMFSTLSVEDIITETIALNMYPNPAVNFITIEALIHIDKVELYSLLGKRVLQTIKTEDIKVNHLSKGVYLVKIYAGNNQVSKKLILK